MQLTVAAEEYLCHLAACGRSPHTLAQARRHLALFASWAAHEGHRADLAAWSPSELARFLTSPVALVGRQGARRSQGSLNGLRSTVRCFFGWAADAGFITASPARLLRRAQAPPPPPRALSQADQDRLLAALDGAQSWPDRRDRALFRFMLGTGVRLGAALALRVEHIDIEEGAVDLRTKGAQRALLPISSTVRTLLREWLPQEGPAFPARSGAPLSSRHAQRRLWSWCWRAGIRPASPHQLRHSHAVTLLERTGDVALVQAALLHRSISSTQVYLRVPETRLRAALG